MNVWPGHPDSWSASLDYAEAQTDAELRATPGAGMRLIITWLAISNDADVGNVVLLDGVGGAVLFELYLGVNRGAAASGIHISLSANTPLVLASTGVAAHAVNVGGHREPAP